MQSQSDCYLLLIWYLLGGRAKRDSGNDGSVVVERRRRVWEEKTVSFGKGGQWVWEERTLDSGSDDSVVVERRRVWH